MILRAIIGFGCGGFSSQPSRLTAKALPSERGRVFSIYMVGLQPSRWASFDRPRIARRASFNAIVALFGVALTGYRGPSEPPGVSARPHFAHGALARAALSL